MEKMSKNSFKVLKDIIKEEMTFFFTKSALNAEKRPSHIVDVLPILHNDNLIILQFKGWSINLYDDGTYIWEDTSGG
jgi:hypothetical protein